MLAKPQFAKSPQLRWVERFSHLLDTRFRIPGTRIRFGIDPILGLIPGLGDVLSMAFSGLLIVTMAKHGASGKLVTRMVLNVLLDTIVGSVPVFGTVFDVFYKANYRNLRLMRAYYDEGKHTGSVWPLVTAVIAVFLIIILLLLGAAIFALVSVLASLIW